MFCVYKTDPNWIKTLRSLNPDVQVNFWRKGRNALNLPLGSWFYFNERRTRNIVGRGMFVGYEVMSVKDAWDKYGNGNGVSSLEEINERAL
jgi:putative restriction endonuclease